MRLGRRSTAVPVTRGAFRGAGVRARILVPFALLVLFLVGAFLATTYVGRERELREKAQGVEHLFHQELDHVAGKMRRSLEAIAHNEEIKAAFLERDREALLRHARPMLDRLNEERPVTHFYLTGPDRVTFLRVHDPGRYGGVIDRTTMREAEKTGRTTHGVELGALGTLTLRVVMPWRDGDRLMGYLELGAEIGQFANEIHRVLGVDLLALTYKEFLDQARWREGMRLLGREGEWDRFESAVVSIQTTEGIPEALAEILRGDGHPHDERVTIEDDGKILSVVFLPLMDAGEREVGDLVVIRDITKLQTDFWESMALIVALCLAAGGAAFALFFVVLGRVDRDVWAARQNLEELVRERTEKLSDEIGERKRTEALKTRLGRIIEDSVNEIYVFDAGTSRFIQVNHGARNNLGYSMDELRRMTPLDLKPTFSRERFEALIEPLRTGEREQVEFETDHKRKDGSLYPVDVRLQLFRSETPPFFVATVREAEHAVVESERQFRAVADGAPVILWMSDASGGNTFFNRKWIEFTGQ
ncbi:MAG: PAS domain S-box protein, partial [Alphaproteobacteria bacterium]